MYTKTRYSFVIEAPGNASAIELAKKFANPDADHLEDPSAEDSELHLERCARLKEGDDAAVDFGSDEPRV
jgi:hypothetical protein